MPPELVEREILILRDLDHPHVLRLYEWFQEEEDNIHIVTDIARGGNLQELLVDHLSRTPRAPLREAWVSEIIQ